MRWYLPTFLTPSTRRGVVAVSRLLARRRTGTARRATVGARQAYPDRELQTPPSGDTCGSRRAVRKHATLGASRGLPAHPYQITALCATRHVQERIMHAGATSKNDMHRACKGRHGLKEDGTPQSRT